MSNYDELIKWCKLIGNKVIDTTIDPYEVLSGFLETETIAGRPAKMPVWIDWPEEFYINAETVYRFMLDRTHQFQLYETELRLVAPSEEGDIRFELLADDVTVPLKLKINEIGYQFIVEEHTLSIRHGYREDPIENFFDIHQPTIYFFDGSLLAGNRYTVLKTTYPPFASEKITTWDWTGTNIRNESQGVAKEQDSIQFKVIETLKTRNFDLIFDDDSSGEIADVVAITDRDNTIEMELYHCKFSGGDNPGARIDDLYAVCGQAQKSISWKDRIYQKPDEMFMHLQRREQKRLEEHAVSRIERGSIELIETLKVKSHSCPIDIKVFIVQPGLSKARASDDQLRLLSVTENYLMETFKLPFGVIASP